jgi:ABC-type antimicrobial peptide transport system permease subunit
MLSSSLAPQRLTAGMLSVFAGIALLLAVIGIYGVMSYTVSQRTHEIGIRMALGADRGTVIDLVLRGAFKRVAIGLLLGLPLAIGAGRLIAAQLYGVSFWDPLALGVATISLGICAFVAAIIPALRAATISPIRALRTE